MKNILVTGHNGFLGKALLNILSKENVNVYGVSRGLESKLECLNYDGDITNINLLQNILSSKSIDTIIHLAGKAIVSECEQNPFDSFKVNALGTASVFEAARICRVSKIISVETDKVYGIQKTLPTTEKEKLNPGTPYEFSKALAAYIADFYRSYYAMDIVSVRPANLIGGNDHNFTRILPNAFKCISEGKGIPVYEVAQNMYRDFIYVDDVAKALYLIAKNKTKNSIYNLSPNKKINILNFAKLINKVLDYKIPPEIIKKEIDFKEIPEQSIDGSLFEKDFNFQYTPLEEIILNSYEDFIKN